MAVQLWPVLAALTFALEHLVQVPILSFRMLVTSKAMLQHPKHQILLRLRSSRCVSPSMPTVEATQRSGVDLQPSAQSPALAVARTSAQAQRD